MPDIPLNREDGADMFVTSLLAMDTSGDYYFTSYVTEADDSSARKSLTISICLYQREVFLVL